MKLLLCLAFWTRWRLMRAGLALRKAKWIVAYQSRLLGATNHCCHWSRDQLLLGKAPNFWLFQALPLSSAQSLCLICWCLPPCWHTICLLWLWITQFNLPPNPVLLPEEYSQPLTEHSYTSCCSRNHPPAERMTSVMEKKKKEVLLWAPASNTEKTTEGKTVCGHMLGRQGRD